MKGERRQDGQISDQSWSHRPVYNRNNPVEVSRDLMTARKRTPASVPAPPAGKAGFSLISDEKLLDLYRAMLRCRMLRERIEEHRANRISRNKMRAHENGAGCEAPAAGVTLALVDGDTIVPAPGDQGPCLVKGVSPGAIFSFLRTGRTPAAYSRANTVKPSGSFAARFETAAAIARENKRARKGKIVVLFLGPEDAQSGIWPESLRLAVSRRLPVILVSTAADAPVELSARSHELGLPTMTVDKDDVVAIYRAASEAIAHARRGNGPTLIDCRPFLAAGQRKLPAAQTSIRTMEKYLAAKGLFDRKFKAEVETEFEDELEQADGVRLARSRPRLLTK
jgi:pyruvate dehydrogenase E1 component alpha subunit